MAKRLLLNVLLQVLGDFVEGLTEDNLKIGVWSGEVVLENLTLSKTLLRRFNSPLALKHGFVKRMELIVPWATLESNPVKILIDGVNLILEPVDLSSLQPEAIRESMLANKFYKLNKADKAYQPNESEEASTYFQRLTAKILGMVWWARVGSCLFVCTSFTANMYTHRQPRAQASECARQVRGQPVRP
jgi:vacuolar protein sorting-associated protein 13A/C